MIFEGQYLTYEEYQELGGTLEETPFNLLEFSCRKQIDENTQSRLKNLDTSSIPNEVKLCMFNLINCVDKYSETIDNSKGDIESESVDGYSVKYINSTQISDIVKSKNDEIVDIIKADLFGVIVNNEHIIYLGVK